MDESTGARPKSSTEGRGCNRQWSDLQEEGTAGAITSQIGKAGATRTTWQRIKEGRNEEQPLRPTSLPPSLEAIPSRKEPLPDSESSSSPSSPSSGNPGRIDTSPSLRVDQMADLIESAELTVVDATRRDLYHSVARGGSYLGLWRALPDLADELDQQGIEVGSTVEMLKDDESFGDMVTMLHSISPRVMESILRETVGHDFYKSKGAGHLYDSDCAGTYVVALYIADREGKFLAGSEMRSLVRALRLYVQAYEAFVEGQPTTADRGRLARHVRKVDMVVGKQDVVGLRWVTSSAAKARVSELADMFERRIRADLDPTGTVYQLQSPLMVGCSGSSMKKRVESHDPLRALTSTTYTWALTARCIQEVMGLEVGYTCIPVIPVYEEGKLSMSEQLLTTLARSFTTQHGYNVIQGGGRKEIRAKELAETKNIVHGRAQWLADNLKATMAELQRQADTCDLLAEQKQVIELWQQLAGAIEPVTEMWEQMEGTRERMEALVKETEAMMQSCEEQGAWETRVRQEQEARDLETLADHLETLADYL